MIYGATIDDWSFFSEELGLRKYLLPTVCNPRARVSPTSSLVKKDGSVGFMKVPSMYNKAGQVVGIKDWPERLTTVKDITEWARMPDYGICIRTGDIVGLDIDVDSEELAASILKTIDDISIDYGFVLPIRRRVDSPRFLVFYRTLSPEPYASLVTYSGAIERLGTGEQFMVCGTHKSGTRYTVDFRVSTDIKVPTLPLQVHLDIFEALIKSYSISGEAKISQSSSLSGVNIDMYDPIVELLDSLGTTSKGAIMIKCPFSAEHSDSGANDSVSSTVYFPKGQAGKVESGVFNCSHAHCAEKTQEDFYLALNIKRPEITFLPVVEEPQDRVYKKHINKKIPNVIGYKRDQKGMILASAQNLINALCDPHTSGLLVRYDRFSGDYLLYRSGESQSMVLEDTDYITIRAHLETNANFSTIQDTELRKAVRAAAEKYNSFDSAQEWLHQQEYDGVSRIGRFLTDCLGADDTPHNAAIGKYMWTTLAGRLLEPGVKADMVPVMVGKGGLYKSEAIEAIAPFREWHGTLNLADGSDMMGRKAKGVCIMEVPELQGFHKASSRAVKAYLSLKEDVWNEKYMETPARRLRRMLLVGTTNEQTFLHDETGNRKWLPFNVVNKCDVLRIRKYRSQLWAEARVLFLQNGVMYQDVEIESEETSRNFFAGDDTWINAIDEYLRLNRHIFERGYVTLRDISTDALRIPVAQETKSHIDRIARCLKILDFTPKRVRIGDKTLRIYEIPKEYKL